MAYIGKQPTSVPLTSADITDGIITSAKIADGTIVNADINSSAAIDGTKISGSFGKVLQVISATDSTARSTTSTSFVTASNTMSVSITPSSSSNKILIIASGNQNSGGGGIMMVTIYRGATNLGDSTYGMTSMNTGDVGAFGSFSMNYLDSPSTTSATTYQVYIKSNNGNTIYLNGGSGSTTSNAVKASITCLEIAG